MADVNWTQYRCNLCLMLGLAVSAVIAGLCGWLLIMIGLPVFLSIVLFLVVWAVLGYLVDNHCRGLTAAGSGAETAIEMAETAPAAEAADRQAAETTARREAKKGAAAEAERPAADKTSRRQAAEGAVNVDRDGDGVVEGADEGTRPETLDGPRDGKADDLKKIKGIGPKLEQLCNRMGFYHFDQIAAWTEDEIAWVDSNLEGFRGRVTRDEWVAQARLLAGGGETEFSRRLER